MLEVRLIGKFDIRLNGEPVVLSTRTSQSIFAFLILTAGTQHRREKLAGLFWPEVSEQKARTYLRQELWRIRKALSTNTTTEYLGADDISIFFRGSEDYWLDVKTLTGPEDHASVQDLVDGLAVYKGELLPGFYDNWVTEQREHLQSIFEKRMEQLLGILETEQRWHDMKEWADRWISNSSASERAYQYLMLAYKSLGDHARVASTYERCVQALLELDLEPSEQTRSYLVRRKSSLNIPIPLTSFIGRETELKEVADLLSKSRLVTLTGSGGVGKTRLAIQVIADVLDLFPAGIWFLDLSSLIDPTLIPNTIVSLLGLHEATEISLTQLLVNYFRPRRALVIFDNCEHLIEACASLANILLSSCEELSILATSREGLRISGEVSYRVPSLVTPNMEGQSTVEELMNTESVKLFIERARIAEPSIKIRSDHAILAAQICKRLDGIPLAIELAATRVNVLTLEQIIRRLDDRLNLLSNGLRSSLPRHQTLRAMIEWSYDLLSEKEQILFRRLAIFTGGWTLESAERICSGDKIPPFEVLDILDSLINKSLVLIDSMDDYTPTERSLRYHELETIRQFALEKMVETDEVNSLRDRHLQYFLQIAEQAEIGMRGSDDLMWLERLEAEYENCRVALSCAMESTSVDPQVALKFSSALRDFWNIHGHSNEGFHWLMNSLNHAGDTSTIYRCKALCGLANLPMSSEQRNEIKDLINIAVPLARQLDVPNLILEALYYSITKYGNNLLDDADETRKRMDECLALAHLSNNQFFLIYVLGFRNWYFVHDAGERMKLADDVYKIAIELGNKRALAEALSTLGHMYRSQGHYEKASLAIKECLRLSKELGDRHETVWYYWAICNIENQKGDLSSALQFAEDGLQLARDLSDPLYTSYLLLGLGWNAYLSSDYKKAYACLEECLAIRRDLGVKSFLLSPLICLGPVAFTQGDVEQAKKYFSEAFALFTLTGKYWLLPDCFERMSGLSFLSSECVVSLLANAATMRDKQGTVTPASERNMLSASIEKARAKLDEKVFQMMWDEGSAMSYGEAIRYATKLLIA